MRRRSRSCPPSTPVRQGVRGLRVGMRTIVAQRSGDLAAGLESVGRRLLARGERAAAEQAWREMSQLAEQTTRSSGQHYGNDRPVDNCLRRRSSGRGAVARSIGAGPRRCGWTCPHLEYHTPPCEAAPCLHPRNLGRPAEVSLSGFPRVVAWGRPGLAERALLLSFLHQCARYELSGELVEGVPVQGSAIPTIPACSSYLIVSGGRSAAVDLAGSAAIRARVRAYCG